MLYAPLTIIFVQSQLFFRRRSMTPALIRHYLPTNPSVSSYQETTKQFKLPLTVQRAVLYRYVNSSGGLNKYY